MLIAMFITGIIFSIIKLSGSLQFLGIAGLSWWVILPLLIFPAIAFFIELGRRLAVLDAFRF